MASSGNSKDLAALYIKRRAVLLISFASMQLVCREESCGTTALDSKTRGKPAPNPSRGTDRHDNSFAPVEKRKNTQELLPRKIFLVEQSHAIRPFFARHNLGPGIDPFA